MKRERKPPKKWRRNMVAAAAFLAILDAVILSATPNSARIAFALIVTVVVGYAIFAIWRSNAKLERAAADTGEGAGTGDAAGGRSRKKRLSS